MDSDSKLIYVHGAGFSKDLDRRLVVLYCRTFRLDVRKLGNEKTKLFPFLQESLPDRNVELFEWKGLAYWSEIQKGARDLVGAINEAREDRVILVGGSLGSLVIGSALEGVNREVDILTIGSPHLLNVGTENVRSYTTVSSSGDNYLRNYAFPHLQLAFFPNLLTLNPTYSTRDIPLEGLDHLDLFEDSKVLYEGKERNLYGIYKEIVDSL